MHSVCRLLGYGTDLKEFTWWRHQMETFSALLAICAGNSPFTGEFPSQSQWRGALTFYLICAWTSGWVNNREAGDLRRHRAYYDVTIMNLSVFIGQGSCLYLFIISSVDYQQLCSSTQCDIGYKRIFRYKSSQIHLSQYQCIHAKAKEGFFFQVCVSVSGFPVKLQS